MSNKLMIHVVSGYPSLAQCLDLIQKIDQTNPSYIEVQLPFSDPMADGETIMRANDAALELGMTTKKTFELIRASVEGGVKTPICLMSYYQKIFSWGTDKFCKNAAEAGAKFLIIPDLPPDSRDYKNLSKSAVGNNLSIVPVISPGISEKRLKITMRHQPELVYLTSIKGITGNKFNAAEGLKRLIKQVRRVDNNIEIAVGFGIASKEDVRQILAEADIAVVGSAVLKQINQGGTEKAIKFIRGLL